MGGGGGGEVSTVRVNGTAVNSTAFICRRSVMQLLSDMPLQKITCTTALLQRRRCQRGRKGQGSAREGGVCVGGSLQTESAAAGSAAHNAET